MAVMPNGLTAAREYLGSLFVKQIGVMAALASGHSPIYLTHVRQCLNSLRCGMRLRRSDKPLPHSEEVVNGEDWLRVGGAWDEFRYALSHSHIVLNLDHISWCMDQLREGRVLEIDDRLQFRPLGEQLDYFVMYDGKSRSSPTPFTKYAGITDMQFVAVTNAIENGLFSADDLLFYCHAGQPLLTAELARAYINGYGGGIYTRGEPILQAVPPRESMMDSVVRETKNSQKFPRPHGFYVKRLPSFHKGRRFASKYDYANIEEVERGATSVWPMSCEAFQLFGITHKCYSDLYRPSILALPGFSVRESDVCHAGYPDPGEKIENMLTISTGIGLSLDTICRRANLTDGEKIGFGFLDPWAPAQGALNPSRLCGTCRRPFYVYSDCAICSFCGSII